MRGRPLNQQSSGCPKHQTLPPPAESSQTDIQPDTLTGPHTLALWRPLVEVPPQPLLASARVWRCHVFLFVPRGRQLALANSIQKRRTQRYLIPTAATSTQSLTLICLWGPLMPLRGRIRCSDPSTSACAPMLMLLQTGTCERARMGTCRDCVLMVRCHSQEFEQD